MRFILIILLTICPSGLFAQSMAGWVFDALTNQPVADAFVFVSNTGIGTTTDMTGHFELQDGIPKDELLIFSHLNYQTRELYVDSFEPGDTIKISPQEQFLESVMVTRKARPGVRKRRLRAFRKAFFGTLDEEKIQLLNPEVILFTSQGDTLLALAQQPLKLTNHYLGFLVDYYLDKFELHPDGTTHYAGNAFIVESEGDRKVTARWKRNRNLTYQRSAMHFFRTLVKGETDTTLIGVGHSRLRSDGSFELFLSLHPDSIPFIMVGEDMQLPCPEYLTIVHKDRPIIREKPRVSSHSDALEKKEEVPIAYECSYIKSKTGHILLSQEGRVLNPSDLEEYGYWTDYRTLHLLPRNYP